MNKNVKICLKKICLHHHPHRKVSELTYKMANQTSSGTDVKCFLSFERLFQPRCAPGSWRRATTGRRSVYWGPSRPACLLDWKRGRDAPSNPAVLPWRLLSGPQFPPRGTEPTQAAVLLFRMCFSSPAHDAGAAQPRLCFRNVMPPPHYTVEHESWLSPLSILIKKRQIFSNYVLLQK